MQKVYVIHACYVDGKYRPEMVFNHLAETDSLFIAGLILMGFGLIPENGKIKEDIVLKFFNTGLTFVKYHSNKDSPGFRFRLSTELREN